MINNGWCKYQARCHKFIGRRENKSVAEFEAEKPTVESICRLGGVRGPDRCDIFKGYENGRNPGESE